LLTLDEAWSTRLLANEKVTAAMRRLAPEGDPNRHHNIQVGGRLATLNTRFTSSQQTADPLTQFVTAEHMQQVLADLRVIAEAAESLPEPAKPGPDDNLVRITSVDAMAPNQLVKMVILLALSIAWWWLNSSAWRGQ
jgi:hypothetical protein